MSLSCSQHFWNRTFCLWYNVLMSLKNWSSSSIIFLAFFDVSDDDDLQGPILQTWFYCNTAIFWCIIRVCTLYMPLGNINFSYCYLLAAANKFFWTQLGSHSNYASKSSRNFDQKSLIGKNIPASFTDKEVF